MTAPGSYLFMGEEFLEDKKWSDDRNYRDARGLSGFIWWDGIWR